MSLLHDRETPTHGISAAPGGIAATSRIRALGWPIGIVLAPLAVAGVLAFHQGGYSISSWGRASMVLLVVLAGVSLLARCDWGGRWGRIALGGWVGLAAWQGLSSRWADQPSAAIDNASLTLLYGVAFALALAGVRHRAALKHVTVATLALVAAVGIYAVCSRLLPGLVHGESAGGLPGLGTRLSTPISYWNALGALLAFGATLALGVSTTPNRSAWIRGAAAGLIPMFSLGILFTLSRGAFAVLAIGTLIVLALKPGRDLTIAVLLLVAAATTPVLIAANRAGLVTASGPLLPHGRDGAYVGLVLLGAAAVSAAACALPPLLGRITGNARRAVKTTLIVGLLALLVAGVGFGPSPARIPHELGRAFDSFRTPSHSTSTGAGRLTQLSSSGRWLQWQVAAAEFKSAPLVGTGSGDFRFWWQQRRDSGSKVLNAHSLYLEVLAESGIVGLVLLLLVPIAGLCAIAPALKRAARTSVGHELATSVAACAVIGAHLGEDWDWQLPAVVLPAIVLGGAALKTATLARAHGTAAGHGRAFGAVLALVCALGFAAVAGPTEAASKVARGDGQASAGDRRGALESSRAAERADPSDPAAYRLEGNVLSDLGHPEEADSAFAAAMRRSPRDTDIMEDWAASLLGRDDVAAARLLLRRVRLLNPLDRRLPYLEQLDTGQ